MNDTVFLIKLCVQGILGGIPLLSIIYYHLYSSDMLLITIYPYILFIMVFYLIGDCIYDKIDNSLDRRVLLHHIVFIICGFLSYINGLYGQLSGAHIILLELSTTIFHTIKNKRKIKNPFLFYMYYFSLVPTRIVNLIYGIYISYYVNIVFFLFVICICSIATSYTYLFTRIVVYKHKQYLNVK